MRTVDYCNKTSAETLQLLEAQAEGLSTEQANNTRSAVGENSLPEAQRRSLLTLVIKQFNDFMILILLAAAVISGFIGDLQDTIAILVIVCLNAIIGAVQASRAERAVAALKKMAASKAKVIRDGLIKQIDAAELVPGDVVILEAGNIVPADLRLLQTEELQIDESSLTGESVPSAKQPLPLPEKNHTLGDCSNIAFKSTVITRGRGNGVVVTTGLNTEIGRIAAILHADKNVQTPLQKRLNLFGKHLALAILAICAIIFIAGMLQGQPLFSMLLTAISLAVAAMPEALPAVVTISLAFGARKLIQHHALVRNLPAVETLGSVTYICTDKTGTLTQNQMTAESFIGSNLAPVFASESVLQQSLGQALALSNDVIINTATPAGEPTELALFNAALAFGFDKKQLETNMPRLAALAFDSERKQMTTLHQSTEGVVAYVKGAPEKVLQQCTHGLSEQGVVQDGFQPEAMLNTAEELASQGYRVIAFAQRTFTQLPASIDNSIEQQLCFLGLVTLIDPPREEARAAVDDCKSAGITPVMITGDHSGTAMAIATRLGINSSDSPVMTGQALEALSQDEFLRKVETTTVYARVSPQQKLRIVEALQHKGQFVAMTGDGVNDAPALKRANIGIAMGGKGTDVAREAADMVLLDNNFASIVLAIKAGRRIFDNIRKFIKYTMSSNAGEIWTLFLAPLMGLPIPLLPIHILWINLVTDGLPGLAYTAEPAEKGVMQRPPRPTNESIFAHGMWQYIIWTGLLIGGISIAAQAWSISQGQAYWQTIVFTVLTLSQLFHSLAVRSETTSLFSLGLFSNKPMLLAIGITILAQMAVIYVPAFNSVFHTQPLPLFDLIACFAISTLVLVAVEIQKLFLRSRKTRV